MIARFDGASPAAGFSTSLEIEPQPAVVERVVGRDRIDDPVAAGFLGRDLHQGDDRGVGLVIGVDQLADARPIADHDIVGQDDRERLVADQVLGHQDGVTETELLLLADVGDLGEIADRADLPQHLDVALLLEQVLELVGEVEVVLDRPLLAGGDDDHLLDAGRHGLLDRVLDDRLVDEREHLLGLGLRRRQETGAPTCGREDGLSNAQSNLVMTGVGGSGQYSRGGWDDPPWGRTRGGRSLPGRSRPPARATARTGGRPR